MNFRGMIISEPLQKASQKTGIKVNRIPHDAGPIAKSGTGRSAIHDNGNKQAINPVKRKIEKIEDNPIFFQPSQTRQRKKEEFKQLETPQLDKRSQKAEAKNLLIMHKNQSRK